MYRTCKAHELGPRSIEEPMAPTTCLLTQGGSSSVLGLNLCFGGFAALSKDPRLRGCAFNMNIQNAVDQHELLLIARKGVDALQELATSSATSGRSQRKRDMILRFTRNSPGEFACAEENSPQAPAGRQNTGRSS